MNWIVYKYGILIVLLNKEIFNKGEKLCFFSYQITCTFYEPYEPSAARANVLTYVVLRSMTIKLNPLWETEVSKSALINPWLSELFVGVS